MNRREDRLLFDYQTSLAEQLNCQPVAAKRASEVLMLGLLPQRQVGHPAQRHPAAEHRRRDLPPSDQAPVPINERFQIAHEMLDVRHEHVFSETPSAILECFLLISRTPHSKG